MVITHRTWVLSLIAFNTACGVGDPTGIEPATHKASLEIISSFPSDGATDVPISTSQIIVQFSEPLDVGSLDDTHIHLMPGDGNLVHSDTSSNNDNSQNDNKLIDDYDLQTDIIPGQIYYDAQTSTLHFTPSTQLNHGTKYHLRAQNLRLQSGIELEDGKDTIMFTFTTAHLMEAQRIYYRKDRNGNMSPGVRQKYFYQSNKNLDRLEIYDGNNNISKTIRYNVPLPGGIIADSAVYLSDNSIQSYSNDLRDEFGLVIAHGKFTDPGRDGVWGNDNDLLSSFTENNHLFNGHYVSTRFAIKPELLQQGINAFQWDDRQGNYVMSSLILTEHRGPEFDHRLIIYKSPGLNGIIDFDEQGTPAPIDDMISYWIKKDFDPKTGLRIRSWNMEGNYDHQTNEIDPLKNAQLFTDQNAVISLAYYTYKAQSTPSLPSLLDTVYYYKSPGIDGNWTSYEDNELDYKMEYQYDANGNLQKRLQYKFEQNGNEYLYEERDYQLY